MMVVAVIGAGAIGSAVVKGLLKKKAADRVIATRRHVEKLKELEQIGVTVTNDNRKAAAEADVVFVCVKPKDVVKVLGEIKEHVKNKLVVSMAAAVSLEVLKKAAPEAKFVRAMPNIAVLVQHSFIGYCVSEEITDRDKADVEKILGALGRFIEIDEQLMDALTALSGCAPAVLSVILDAMTQAGLETGLPKDLALIASAQSMVGTGKLILEAGKTPSKIREIVTTPGGVTEEELKELRKFPVTHALVSAIKVGETKAKKISNRLKERSAL